MMNQLSRVEQPALTLYNTIQRAKTGNFITSKRADYLSYEYQQLLLTYAQVLTHKASTSLSKANFQLVINTLDYLFQHAFQHSNHDLSKLADKNLQDYCDEGIELVKQDIKQCHELLGHLQNSNINISNDRYNDVLNHQIPQYLETLEGYEAVINYHHIDADLDYPLLDGLALFHDMYHKDGTDLIHYYLGRLWIEMQFCIPFSSVYPSFCQHFQMTHHVSTEFMHLNFCEVTLNQSIAHYLLHDRVGILLNDTDITRLRHILHQDQSLPQMIKKALQAIIAPYSQTIQEYLKNYDTTFLYNCQQFIQHDFQFLIYEHTNHQEFIIKLPPSLKSNTFERILTQLQDITSSTKFVSFLNKKVLNIKDLIDVFENIEFPQDYYQTYFMALSPIQITTLIKIIAPDINAFQSSQSLEDDIVDNAQIDALWLSYFHSFIKTLPLSFKQQIITIIPNLVIQ